MGNTASTTPVDDLTNLLCTTAIDSVSSAWGGEGRALIELSSGEVYSVHIATLPELLINLCKHESASDIKTLNLRRIGKLCESRPADVRSAVIKAIVNRTDLGEPTLVCTKPLIGPTGAKGVKAPDDSVDTDGVEPTVANQ